MLEDPYPVYSELRERDTVCRIGPGTYGFTRHADVRRLLRDPRLGSEFPHEYHELSAGPGEAAEVPVRRPNLLFRTYFAIELAVQGDT